MNYFVPEGQNYIILESLNSIKENQYPLSIHVLMFIEDSDYYILGRGHESDVRISDISVSRSHAKICMKDKKFYLEDTGSKFGTLVLAKDDVEIKETQQILQIGRTLISAVEFDFVKHLNKNIREENFGIGNINMNMNQNNDNYPMSN
jgi:pSer/pThr/pTyr-binding forkhead associated (FHA) protein